MPACACMQATGRICAIFFVSAGTLTIDISSRADCRH